MAILKRRYGAPDKIIAAVLTRVILTATFVFGTACVGGKPLEVENIPTVMPPSIAGTNARQPQNRHTNPTNAANQHHPTPTAKL